MSDYPKISIVTLSFNQHNYLERAIRSVLSQDYPMLEYIVVDPGSTDGSRAVIEKFRHEISHCVYKPDNGPAQGLNNGFACATGSVFGFINADDILQPGALRHVAEYFLNHPEVDVLLGCGLWIDGESNVIKHVAPSRYSLQAAAYGRFEFIQQATFFRGHFFEKIGGFNEKNRICWDGELLYDLYRIGARFSRTRQELGAFRVYDGTITDSHNYSEKLRSEEARIYADQAAANGSKTRLQLSAAYWLVRKWLFDPWYVCLRLSRNFWRMWKST